VGDSLSLKFGHAFSKRKCPAPEHGADFGTKNNKEAGSFMRSGLYVIIIAQRPIEPSRFVKALFSRAVLV